MNVDGLIKQGTVVYFELNADQDFDANAVVDFRTDCKEEFDEEYIEENDLQQLW